MASQNVSKYNWVGFPRMSVNIFWNLAVPLFVSLLGYLPGLAYGGRYDLHKNIALDWQIWSQSSNGLLGAIPTAQADYQNITVPTKFISIEDDKLLAPKRAVEELVKSYGSPIKEHEHLGTGDKSVGAIGHFGFFRSRNSVLWPMADQWFQQHSSKEAA